MANRFDRAISKNGSRSTVGGGPGGCRPQSLLDCPASDAAQYHHIRGLIQGHFALLSLPRTPDWEIPVFHDVAAQSPTFPRQQIDMPWDPWVLPGCRLRASSHASAAWYYEYDHPNAPPSRPQLPVRSAERLTQRKEVNRWFINDDFSRPRRRLFWLPATPSSHPRQSVLIHCRKDGED